ncbi:MAG: SusD/RagB family nutrient-binding outer membrane lipoprotein, partial [Proteiniphilum sp.]|nr:SusD/RagB family nutrient-binding outer membrane lipoprotein [Proteiniphilum sp.]
SAPNYGEVLMEYAEVAFLIAEHFNWRQSDYEAGVRASLAKWGISGTEASDYIAALPTASQRNVLNQKYIALFGQFLEGWSDYRRTGFPDFLIKHGDTVFSGTINGEQVTYTFNPLFGDGGIPSRLYYPVKEQSVNLENYQAAVATQGNDVIETKLWVFK